MPNPKWVANSKLVGHGCRRCGSMKADIEACKGAMRQHLYVMEKRPGTPQAAEAKLKLAKLKEQLSEKKLNLEAHICGEE